MAEKNQTDPCSVKAPKPQYNSWRTNSQSCHPPWVLKRSEHLTSFGRILISNPSLGDIFCVVEIETRFFWYFPSVCGFNSAVLVSSGGAQFGDPARGKYMTPVCPVFIIPNKPGLIELLLWRDVRRSDVLSIMQVQTYLGGGVSVFPCVNSKISHSHPGKFRNMIIQLFSVRPPNILNTIPTTLFCNIINLPLEQVPNKPVLK